MSKVLPERERWRLERQVTLGVIMAMTVQAGAALVWAGSAGERLSQLERRADLAQPLGERLARIEAKVELSGAALARIEARLSPNSNDTGLAETRADQ